MMSDGPVTLAWQACSVDVFNKVMKRELAKLLFASSRHPIASCVTGRRL